MTDSTPARTPTRVDAIAEGWVATLARLDPEVAIYAGVPGPVETFADYSPEGTAGLAQAARSVLAELEAAEVVDAVDRVTIADLSSELRLHLELDDAGWTERDLNVIASPAQSIREIFDLLPREIAHRSAPVRELLDDTPSLELNECRSNHVTLGTEADHELVFVKPLLRKVAAEDDVAFKLGNDPGYSLGGPASMFRHVAPPDYQ